MAFSFLFVLSSLFAGLGVRAQARPAVANGGQSRLTIEDVLRWKMASSPVISPDGKRAAYLVSENDFEKSRPVTYLWWVETETRRTQRLTHIEDGIAEPRWSPDGRWLAFLSARSGGEEGKGKAQVWALPVEGGEASPLTHAPEGVTQYRWSPDSKWVYYVTREALPAAASGLRERQQKQKADQVIVDEEKYRREIWRVAVDGEKLERLHAGDPGLDLIEPSPDGRWLLFRTNLTGDPDHDTRADLWVLDVFTRATKQLTRRAGLERSPVWSPDSTGVAFLAPRVAELRNSQEEVFTMPVTWQGAAPEPQRVSKEFAGNIEDLRWPTKGNALSFAMGVRTGSRLYSMDMAEGVAKPVSPEGVYLTAPEWTSDGGTCVALMESATLLPEIAVLRFGALASSEPQKLTDLNPQLRNFALGAQEIIHWKSKDGKEVEGVLIRPAGASGQKAPLLLDIHGGPYGHRTNTLTTGNVPQLWAARGWLVLQPNYRGSSGYGNDWGLANRGDIGGRDYEDIMAGVDYVIAQGWADEKRMAVMGESYGGYMTNWIISQTQRFQAAVSNFGIFSLLTDFSNSDFPSWETDYLSQYYWDNLQPYLDRSPMKYVKQIKTPVLITHGTDDNNTFISNSREMYQALKLLGRPVKFARFPREGHGFVEPNHVMEQFRLMAAWLDEHVPGAAQRGGVQSSAVQKNGWELRVAAVRTPETYAGISPKGRFVEVELMLRATQPTEERLSLLVFDNAGGDVTLLIPAEGVVAEHPVYPEGLVAETLGQRVLVKSQGQIVAVAPDKNGNHAALAVTIAFDAPSIVREFVLKVKEFPLVRIELPMK